MKTVIKLLADCETKRADKESNGYYIVTEQWNTCFHRWASNVHDRIEVRVNNNPFVGHSYTRIPAALKDKIFFVYVNCLDVEGFTIILRDRELIVGGYEPQRRGGAWLNYAYLIYSPTGEAPTVEGCSEAGAWLKHPNLAPVKFRMEMLCPPVIPVRYHRLENFLPGDDTAKAVREEYEEDGEEETPTVGRQLHPNRRRTVPSRR